MVHSPSFGTGKDALNLAPPSGSPSKASAGMRTGSQGQATVEVLLTESALAAEENRSPGWSFLPGWWPLG
jgi:hypothetical protein